MVVARVKVCCWGLPVCHCLVDIVFFSFYFVACCYMVAWVHGQDFGSLFQSKTICIQNCILLNDLLYSMKNVLVINKVLYVCMCRMNAALDTPFNIFHFPLIRSRFDL